MFCSILSSTTRSSGHCTDIETTKLEGSAKLCAIWSWLPAGNNRWLKQVRNMLDETSYKQANLHSKIFFWSKEGDFLRRGLLEVYDLTLKTALDLHKLNANCASQSVEIGLSIIELTIWFKKLKFMTDIVNSWCQQKYLNPFSPHLHTKLWEWLNTVSRFPARPRVRNLRNHP